MNALGPSRPSPESRAHRLLRDGYPPEIARAIAPELSALVGYAQHRPNLGNYEGQCPSIPLRNDVPSHIGAIDALRPDQEAMIATYIDEMAKP